MKRVGGVEREPSLQDWRELYRKINGILDEARQKRASVVEIQVTPEWTVWRYWDGATWREKPNSMYNEMNARNKNKYGTSGTHTVRLY